MQEDGNLIDSVIRLSDGELPAGVSEETLKQFEAKLGSPLPELLRQLLRKANGGETILARSERPFIPNSLEAMGTTELWKYMLQVVEESTGGDFEPDVFIGRYLPLGDDYGGEVIVIDLRT